MHENPTPEELALMKRLSKDMESAIKLVVAKYGCEKNDWHFGMIQVAESHRTILSIAANRKSTVSTVVGSGSQKDDWLESEG